MVPRAAIVTGSARGIGKAIANRLAGSGLRVCINDISIRRKEIDDVVDALNRTYGPGTSIGVTADVTNSADVNSMVSETVSRLGPLAAMVANAGISGNVKQAVDLTENDWRSVLNVNVIGTFNCYQAAAKQMISQGPTNDPLGYRILGAASIVAIKPPPMSAPYSASKYAVCGMTKVFALDLARHGITVNAYAPGTTKTAMWDGLVKDMEDLGIKDKTQNSDQFAAAAVPMGRIATADDIANVVGTFLVGPHSSFMTGQIVTIDGGATLL